MSPELTSYSYLVSADVNVLAGEQADDLLEHSFQELKCAFLASTIHILMHAPVYWDFSHITCIATTGST